MDVYWQIKEKFVLPNAYQDWTKYRKYVTELVMKSADINKEGENNKWKKLLIVGAGQCNDFDLVELIQKYAEVTLLDVDINAMESAVSWMPERVRSRIVLKEGTVTGISEEDQNEICTDLLAGVMKQKKVLDRDSLMNLFTDSIYTYAKKLYQHEKDFVNILPANEYDVVVCLGVHSQLFSVFHYFINMLLYNVAQQIFYGQVINDDFITMIFKSMNDHIIPHYNSALLNCAGTRLILGNEYDRVSPVEGADQCIRNMRIRNINMKEEHVEWNFNPTNDIKYDMLFQIIDI